MNNDLINKAQSNIINGSEYVKPAIDEYAASLINDLMKSIKSCRTSWKLSCDNFQDPVELGKFERRYKQSLMMAISEGGINTPEQIHAGMKKCRAEPDKYLPAPGLFVSWCKPDPADYGLPSVEQAYKECCSKSHMPNHKDAKWTHGVIYHAGREVGWYSIRNSSTKAEIAGNKKLFVQAYDSLCKRVMEGEAFSVPEQSETLLEHHQNGEKVATESNKQAAAQAMSELRGKL